MIIIDLLKGFLEWGQASEGGTSLEAISAIWDKPGSDKNCGSWSGTQYKGIDWRISESLLSSIRIKSSVDVCLVHLIYDTI